MTGCGTGWAAASARRPSNRRFPSANSSSLCVCTLCFGHCFRSLLASPPARRTSRTRPTVDRSVQQWLVHGPSPTHPRGHGVPQHLRDPTLPEPWKRTIFAFASATEASGGREVAFRDSVEPSVLTFLRTSSKHVRAVFFSSGMCERTLDQKSTTTEHTCTQEKRASLKTWWTEGTTSPEPPTGRLSSNERLKARTAVHARMALHLRTHAAPYLVRPKAHPGHVLWSKL